MVLLVEYLDQIIRRDIHTISLMTRKSLMAKAFVLHGSLDCRAPRRLLGDYLDITRYILTRPR